MSKKLVFLDTIQEDTTFEFFELKDKNDFRTKFGTSTHCAAMELLLVCHTQALS
jgi:hypothetical protein